MRHTQVGFTLIELMIVVAIVGILAAVALPAYQDYVIRSKMSEAIVALGACKTSVADYMAVRQTVPGDADTAGCSTISSQYVRTLAVANVGLNSQITVTTTNTGVPDCDVVLTSAGGSWLGSSSCDAKYVPANFR